VSTILITLQELGSCSIKHQESGSVITSDTPPEYGGQGRSFSATDLLASALGVCVATNLDSIAIRHGLPLDSFSIAVQKTLSQSPKRIATLDVTITFSVCLEPEVLLRLQRAAEDCAVKRSLHPEVQVTLRFVQPSD
jgi:putative redox protein